MQPQPSDSSATTDLLDLAQAGDEMAFARLFDRHRPQLRQMIALRMDRQLAARVDPSDVVQETHLEAVRRLNDYLRRRPMPFGLWLRKTACERLLMLQRRHLGAMRRNFRREVPLPEDSSATLAQHMLAAEGSPSEHLSRRELARCVRRSVARLSAADQEIVLMRTFEGLSYREISYVLEIKIAATKKRHGRALMRLHKLLTESGLSQSDL